MEERGFGTARRIGVPTHEAQGKEGESEGHQSEELLDSESDSQNSLEENASGAHYATSGSVKGPRFDKWEQRVHTLLENTPKGMHLLILGVAPPRPRKATPQDSTSGGDKRRKKRKAPRRYMMYAQNGGKVLFTKTLSRSVVLGACGTFESLKREKDKVDAVMERFETIGRGAGSGSDRSGRDGAQSHTDDIEIALRDLKLSRQRLEQLLSAYEEPTLIHNRIQRKRPSKKSG